MVETTFISKRKHRSTDIFTDKPIRDALAADLLTKTIRNKEELKFTDSKEKKLSKSRKEHSFGKVVCRKIDPTKNIYVKKGQVLYKNVGHKKL